MAKTEKKKTKPKIEINLQQVEMLAANGLTQQQIADSLGISVSTIESRLRENEEFKDAIKKGKAKGIALIANQLFEKAKSGDTTSIIFYLKTQAGWKETQAVETKISLVDEVASLMEEISNEVN